MVIDQTREASMSTIKLLAVAALTLGEATVAYCQPPAFYSAQLSDDQMVTLFLDRTVAAVEVGFDYDVMIGVGRVPLGGADPYVDPSLHPAAVKCYGPALVMVAGREYPVEGLDATNWKAALWTAVCGGPIS
jgi:hypothetical protein